MPVIQQLSPHVANLIAAGEVVERPASVVKELLENAVDAGATKVTIEIRDGGMTFLRVTDNGCGMSPEDARTAFLRHATSKLHCAEDLAAIGTMGFRGEALAAIASVSRIDLLTKPKGAICGTSLHLEAGKVTEESEAGCPDGTTIIIRDLFFNTPARMKFMKSDTVEGSRVTAAIQLQALAHPETAIQFLRDGKSVLSTPGNGGLDAAVYCVYGRDCARMIPVNSSWDGYKLTGFISKPTDARPSRSLQTFFVNDRPVRSKLMVTALEEAYRNQIMVGKFPACVLHLHLPNIAVDVNVHPAKTEVKFLNEKSVFDCLHYGCLAALNRTPDRPQVHFPEKKTQPEIPAPAAPRQDTFRTMSSAQFRAFSGTMKDAPHPEPTAAAAAAAKIPAQDWNVVREKPILPLSNQPIPEGPQHTVLPNPVPVSSTAAANEEKSRPITKTEESFLPPAPPAPVAQKTVPEPQEESEPEQDVLSLPEEKPWRMVGELYRTYILVEQGDDAFLIDKHAAHERILFEKLKANQEAITGQMLLAPISVRLNPNAAGELLANQEMLESLGFEVEEFGDSTLLMRQIPMDLDPEDAVETLEALGDSLLSGRREQPDTVRDELLHTVACKAAIKAGWKSDEQELLAVVRQVMGREDLKYCPHGRPICVSLSKKFLEKQFKRT